MLYKKINQERGMREDHDQVMMFWSGGGLTEKVTFE